MSKASDEAAAVERIANRFRISTKNARRLYRAAMWHGLVQEDRCNLDAPWVDEADDFAENFVTEAVMDVLPSTVGIRLEGDPRGATVLVIDADEEVALDSGDLVAWRRYHGGGDQCSWLWWRKVAGQRRQGW